MFGRIGRARPPGGLVDSFSRAHLDLPRPIRAGQRPSRAAKGNACGRRVLVPLRVRPTEATDEPQGKGWNYVFEPNAPTTGVTENDIGTREDLHRAYEETVKVFDDGDLVKG